VEFLARRQYDRDRSAISRSRDVLAELTDRQREVPPAAYRAGYFAWPRESTAEEVADSVGVSRPTLQAHLRKAEAQILSALLD
jgi:predicted DNA binding protein